MPQVQPPPPTKAPNPRWMWVAALGSITVAAAVTYWLWRSTPEVRGAFEVGWKIGAGVLAIYATWLGARRISLSEREHQRQLAADDHNRRHAEALLTRQMAADEALRQDAIARQITDLSSKASEQLGSDRPSVRIGGLTDLERLAQSHPALRQTVVDRICAYLRASVTADDGESEWDVRETAQKILRRHLCSAIESTYWENISLNLRGAHLLDFDLRLSTTLSCDFDNASFDGETVFEGSLFGSASFVGAKFNGTCFWTKAEFTSHANFTECSFSDVAGFHATHFTHEAQFRLAQFNRVHFSNAIFDMRADFRQASFSGTSTYYGTVFEDFVDFYGSTSEVIEFGDTLFKGTADFRRVKFAPPTLFQGVKFDSTPMFDPPTTDTRNKFEFTQSFVRARESKYQSKSRGLPQGWTLDTTPGSKYREIIRSSADEDY
ncbi:pentapeptide repeat-containing protein [Amycolatopsis sp. CA-230715]|uniref:pentapeptide repeat-containing protein n=1 Tax=Amycolatopsis sp. CA-230715 TaxID=2745196 RepID=UPI001C0386BE|nr:hypothetical protein [Amycolatopsis sp. CA-230715]